MMKVDWGEVVQYLMAFVVIIGFCLLIMWASPDANSKEDQMKLCMLNKNNTELCELEVGYGDWVRYGYT